MVGKEQQQQQQQEQKRSSTQQQGGGGGGGSTTPATTTRKNGVGPTPKEEIDKQHEYAVLSVQEGMLYYSERIDHGEIPLIYKQRPTCDSIMYYEFEQQNPQLRQNKQQEEEQQKEHGDTTTSSTISSSSESSSTTFQQQQKQQYGPQQQQQQQITVSSSSSFFPCWSSRGQVDVTKLQDLVKEGYNYNDDDNNKNSVTTKGENGSNSNNKNNNNTDGGGVRHYRRKDIKSVTNLWDDANATINNVALCRPSHDSWGIKKVILIFCDDFLTKVYELPWWHTRPDIRNAIQPILDVLKVQHHRVVRLLLASLPPGVTIPIHNDSGEWVKYTHRIHVPIIVNNPEHILFRCGLTPSTMERIDCIPGHIFELNNQAKHAVSNCDIDHRVHLILDYIDHHYSSTLPKIIPHPKHKRIYLNAGETVLQTRRSIDRLVDYGKRKTPTFIILGAQKAGTTSLFEYIMQHPLLVRPMQNRRETHCFDWRWNDNLKTTKEQLVWCQQFYMTKELAYHPSCMTGDSTPSYLLDSRRIIPRIKKVFPWYRTLKFFIMVRDPTQRAISHYAMVTSNVGTPQQLKVRGTEWKDKSFQQVMYDELYHMKECGLIPYWNIETGQCNDKMFHKFIGSIREASAWDKYMKKYIPIGTGSHNLISRGLYELQIRTWMKHFHKSQFLIIILEQMNSNPTNNNNNNNHDGNGDDDGIHSTMKQVWEHLDVPYIDIVDTKPKNSREYDEHTIIDQKTKEYLYRFYEPHNKRFFHNNSCSGSSNMMTEHNIGNKVNKDDDNNKLVSSLWSL